MYNFDPFLKGITPRCRPAPPSGSIHTRITEIALPDHFLLIGRIAF
jgi:hypothetical protein